MPYKIGLIGFESENSIAPIFFRYLSGTDLAGKITAAPMRFRGQHIEAAHFSIKAIFEQIVPPYDKMNTMKYKKPLAMSAAISQKPDIDLLIVLQNYMFYDNDLDIPVVYRHHDVWSPITVKKCNILAMKNYEMKWLIRSYFPHEFSNIGRKIYSFPFTDYKMFNPDREKKYRFINIGPPTATFDSTYRDYIWNNMVRNNWETRDCFEQENLGSSIDDHEIDRFEFRDLLEQSEFLLDTNNWGTYATRRNIECVSAGCIPVMHLESKRAERILKRNNFIEGENCLFYRDLHELRKLSDHINNHITDNEIEDMKDNGYRMMMKYHTPQVRIDQILAEVELLEKSNRYYKSTKPRYI